MKRSFVALLYMAAAPSLAAQTMEHDHHAPAVSASVDQLIEKVRAATSGYADKSVAIAHGYRRVGRDLPMMGEHWLNTRLLIDGAFDVTHPQILTYIDVDGKSVLTGVVFAVPLAEDEAPPDVFGSAAMWHEHNGSIDEEALIPEHHTTGSHAEGTRVAFLHVWARAPFTTSIFDAENWALPFVRAGVGVPQKFSNSAARCLSVVSSRDYYLDMLQTRDSLAFSECDDLSRRLVSRAKTSNRTFSVNELQALESAWGRVQSRLPGLRGLR
jgi:hypothetical protein